MKNKYINGHQMATLLVPEADYNKFPTLYQTGEPFINAYCSSSSPAGECWIFKDGDNIASTGIKGGIPLYNPEGENVPYHGQEFILTVPVFCLSEKGLAAAKEYEDSQQ
jgi:hypothetical protein